jgi:uncharacterized membrane protein
MAEEKQTLASRVMHLPILILAGLVIFVIFLIVAVAVGIVAAAYEFGDAFRKFFGNYFEVWVIAIVLIVLGIVLNFRKRKAHSEQSLTKQEPAVLEKTSEELGAPVQQQAATDQPKQETDSSESKKE